MLRYTWKRLLRAPLAAIGCMLFAAALTAVLCGLHASAQNELQNYELVYDTIPVKLTVTDLMGANTSDLEAPEWVADTLAEPYYNLYKYARDVDVRSSFPFSHCEEIAGDGELIGLTMIKDVAALDPMLGGQVNWYDGYDESILRSEEMVCLIPSSEQVDSDTITLIFYRKDQDRPNSTEVSEYRMKVTIAGTYVGGRNLDGGTTLYCSLEVLKCVYPANGESFKIDSVSATLSDNHLLDDLRAELSEWFVEPNTTGKKTPWGKMRYEYYPYALDIDDSLLHQTTQILQNSMLFNQIAGVMVLVLSTGAGFLIGFLIVRSRKREIALLRTMGTRNVSIYLSFTLEQMVCIALGIALGGAYFLWEPLTRPALLAATYFAGLTAALLIFLRKNLLTTIKEDE